MIIVWRGWGALAFVFIMLGVMGGALFATATDHKAGATLGAGLGCLVYGGAGVALGRWLNVLRPATMIEEQIPRLRADLWQRVRTGTFQAAPGVPVPSTEQEAQVQIEQIVAAQRDRLHAALRNRNTLFWVPMQWWSLAEAAAGMLLLVLALVQALS